MGYAWRGGHPSATPVGETQVRTRILLHTFALILTWEQTAGETVRTQPPIAARSARGNTGTRAGPNGETGEKCASLAPRVARPTAPGNRVARGGTQGGLLNCLTHALPRRLPTPNSVDADGNGYIVIAGRRGPLGRHPRWRT